MIAKKIWFLWYQGKKAMPYLVTICYESLCRLNKGHEVIFLDKNNFREYVSIPPAILQNRNISVQSLSDIIRLNLLDQYGGIWVDATCYCISPLDTWVESYSTGGFFAFSNPAPDRIMANWFIISEKHHSITQKISEALTKFWLHNPNLRKAEETSSLKRCALKKVSDFYSDTSFWFSPIVRKLIRVYPYFIFHYLFYELYKNDREFGKAWDKVKKFPADFPHRLSKTGFDSTISEDLKDEIRSKKMPLYKLSHKLTYDRHKQDSVINYVINNHNHLIRVADAL